MLTCLLCVFSKSNDVIAAERFQGNCSSYLVKPKTNDNLIVNLLFKLTPIDNKYLQGLKFKYLKSKDAYLITDQSEMLEAKWNGKNSEDHNNISFVSKNDTLSDDELWTLQKNNDNSVTIHSKAKLNMVWNVIVGKTNNGQLVNLEEKTTSNSDLQRFNLELLN